MGDFTDGVITGAIAGVLVTFITTVLVLAYFSGEDYRSSLKHVDNDFISSISNNDTIILTTVNGTSNTLETELFWNQVKRFQSQGWNITDIQVINNELRTDGTEVTMTR